MTFSNKIRGSLNRLHNQIVIPLIAAAAVVGIIATLLGISLISGIVERWVDERAFVSVKAFESHLLSHEEVLSANARLAAEDPRLAEAFGTDSVQAVTRFLLIIRPTISTDNIMVLGEDGEVIASTGRLSVVPKDVPFPEDATRWAPLGMAYTTLATVGDLPTMTSFYPVRLPDAPSRRIAVSTVIDDTFLTHVGEAHADAFCYVSADGVCLATTMEDAESGVPEPHLWFDLSEIREAVSSGEPVAVALEIEGVPYHIQSLSFSIEDDPTDASAYIMGIIDSTVAAETQSATVRLIAFWSALAIFALWGLGMVVAQRVSRPIITLTKSIRHVAEGDYTYKVTPAGSNELAQLSRAFNEMTDSLRDRNESLTKKVLELATLYEMSRLLGGTLELEPLLDSVLDSALRIFGVESGYVILRDKETGDLHVAVWRGVDSDKPAEMELKSSISEWVVREGRPLIFNPTRGEHEQVRVDSITGATTALCVPLVSGEGPIGAITVGSKDRSVRFSSDDVRLLSTVANHATIAIGNIELFSSLQEAYLATVRSLAAAVDAKDSYTRGHSDRVAVFAMAIAEKMDLSADQDRTLEMAAYLHDIGKIGVQEAILLKSGKLDTDEMNQMRHHPLIGASILRPVVFPWPVAPIIRHHHERWDGAGYPAGLKGEEIPLLARILTVSDAYEAMTADRPYRLGRGHQDAVAELKRCTGTHFDAKVVDAFIEALEDMTPLPSMDRDSSGAGIQRDEARAVFAAVCDGMFANFRRLGGPKLASNVENTLNELFESASLPCSYSGGRVFFRWDDCRSFEDELDMLREIVILISEAMGRYAGTSLVDHFYGEALGALSGRLRTAAALLEFRPGT